LTCKSVGDGDGEDAGDDGGESPQPIGGRGGLIGARAEGHGETGESAGQHVIERRMDVIGRPLNEFGGRATGKDGSEDFVFPEVFDSQSVQVEGQGESEEKKNGEW